MSANPNRFAVRLPALGLASALLLACAPPGKRPPETPLDLEPSPAAEPSGRSGSKPPSSPLVREAEALLSQGEAERARGKFNEALAQEPRDLRALLGLGLAYEALGAVKQAEGAYRKAVEIDPQFAEAHNNLGLLLRDRGDTSGAIGALEQALRADPRLASAQTNLALALEEAGQGEQAAAAYEKAVALSPKDAMLRANRGLFLLGRGAQPEALTELRAGLAVAEGDRAALLALGNGLRRAGKPDEAVRALRQAIEGGDGKKTPALLSELALAQHAAGDASGAKATLGEALALDPRYATAHYLLGSIEASSGNTRAAQGHYERCLALEPRGPLAAKAKERLGALKKSKR